MNDKIIIVPTINAKDFYNTETHQYSYKELPVAVPKICPCCGRVLGTQIKPISIVNNLDVHKNRQDDYFRENPSFDDSNCQTMAIYHCGSCDELFAVKTDEMLRDDFDNNDYIGFFNAILPSKYPKTTFSEDIENLSNDFVMIYNQAEQAEKDGLTEICGMAYRKALEYLVDAYIRMENPLTALPQDARLSDKIRVIADNNIKTLAERTAWLGNDQTHIISKHPDYSVSDIKYFIENIVKCIDANIAVSKAASIPNVR